MDDINQLYPNSWVGQLFERANNHTLKGSYIICGPLDTGQDFVVEKLMQILYPNKNLLIDCLTLGGDAKVEDIREATEFLGTTPLGEIKTLVIKDIDQLNQFAANALLKTLEEPPKYALIIATTSDEKNVLGTILSRCYKVKVNPVDEEVLANLLQNTYPDLDLDTLAEIKSYSVGRIDLGLRLARDPDLLGQIKNRLEEWQSLVKDNLVAQLSWINKLPEKEMLLEDLALWVNYLAQELGDKYQLNQYKIWDRALRMIKANINPKLVLAHAFVVGRRITAT